MTYIASNYTLQDNKKQNKPPCKVDDHVVQHIVQMDEFRLNVHYSRFFV